MDLESVSARLGASLAGPTLRRKGKAGILLEHVLGASAGNAAIPDFPELGVELKTVPMDPAGKPRESTFVGTIDLTNADRDEWETSRTRAKLARVLFVPIISPDRGSPPSVCVVGRAVLFSPTPEQDAVLRDDFESAMGLIAIGKVELVRANLGRWMQVRPKAADSHVRTRAISDDEGWMTTNPRGFYLRARFVEAILRDPNAVPP